MLPLDYEVLIPEDDSVRLLSRIIEGMDMSELYAAYSSQGRKPATDPRIQFKVVSYGYMQWTYSSRRIESACRRDINYMWLLGGEPVPDHSTLSRFRKGRLGLVMESLFYQLIRELCKLGEVTFEEVFNDGTKLEANANRYSFVWKKALEKHEKKMHEKANFLAEEINKLYFTDFKVRGGSADSDMHVMIKFLERQMHEQGIKRVCGSGKRKSNEQKLLEALLDYRERQSGYEQSKEILGERNSYSKTDKDATFMRMKDDHMKNGQLKAGYNVQLAVSSEYVVGAGLFSDRNDVNTLVEMLSNMKKYMPTAKIKNLTLDSGYESEENYLYLEKNDIKYFIKPSNYEQAKTRRYKKDISRREKMAYNPETDEYTCANGKQLKLLRTFKKKSTSGYESEVTVYECESCEGCPYKEKCTKAKGNRQMQVSKTFLAKREQSLRNINSAEGIILRINRSIQSEGAFGVLKEDRQFTRFLTRGEQNVKTETLLLCFGYNINKLHSKIQSSRCGKGLHIPKAA